jgi:hypothetical protein
MGAGCGNNGLMRTGVSAAKERNGEASTSERTESAAESRIEYRFMVNNN